MHSGPLGMKKTVNCAGATLDWRKNKPSKRQAKLLQIEQEKDNLKKDCD
jgi:hypothetical protein